MSIEYKLGKKIDDTHREFQFIINDVKLPVGVIDTSGEVIVITVGKNKVTRVFPVIPEEEYFTIFPRKGIKGGRGLNNNIPKPYTHKITMELRWILDEWVEELKAIKPDVLARFVDGFKKVKAKAKAVKTEPDTGTHKNINGKAYREEVLKTLEALSCKYSSNVWGTFAQFRALKMMIRKGEHGVKINAGSYSFNLFNTEQCKEVMND